MIKACTPALKMKDGKLQVSLCGRALLRNSLLNKGRAFTSRERDEFNLRGLLPWRELTIREQVALELEHLRAKASDLDTLVLHASPDGRPLYERLGFQQTNEMRYHGWLGTPRS